MTRLRNRRHELFAQAIAEGKSRGDAMAAAGYPWHRGNQNRLAQSPDVIARVEELRKASDHIVDLRKLDRGRILIELARIACADPPLRAAIATNGPDALLAAQPVLLVDIRLEGVLAKHIEMRLLDDRGALSALLQYDGEHESPSNLDLSQSIPADFAALERVLRAVLRNRERPAE
ncbi:hypothetical protein [Bradyrhizobium sp. AZCC 2230]|uniref:hypothetical protein n=1 Tax=Bradyrhizobium sp. AZCC 2230 TaxID=3117021 RepID=UPI002FF18919